MIVEKDGYLPLQISFKEADLKASDTEYDFGSLDMMLEYGVMNGVIADANDNFSHFKGYVTRSAVGFEFKFVGTKAFTGRIELFVDTKASGIRAIPAITSLISTRTEPLRSSIGATAERTKAYPLR